MKNKYPLLIFLIFFLLQSLTIKDSVLKATFQVSGNCMMCKTKIEKTARNIPGVKSAKWNVNKQRLKVKFSHEETTLDKIQKEIAAVGYDTEMYRAADEIYNLLHYCCKYERKQTYKK